MPAYILPVMNDGSDSMETAPGMYLPLNKNGRASGDKTILQCFSGFRYVQPVLHSRRSAAAVKKACPAKDKEIKRT